MCGRYTLTHAERLALFNSKGIDLTPRYNIAAPTKVPILRNDTPDTLSMAHWGFIPFFTKANAKKGFAPINARRETVATSGMFRSAFQAKRCLIPADGFIEWQTVDGKKLPHWFRMHDDSLFFFAGLWPAGSLRRTHRYWRAAPSSQARLIRWCVQFTTVCP